MQAFNMQSFKLGVPVVFPFRFSVNRKRNLIQICISRLHSIKVFSFVFEEEDLIHLKRSGIFPLDY